MYSIEARSLNGMVLGYRSHRIPAGYAGSRCMGTKLSRLGSVQGYGVKADELFNNTPSISGRDEMNTTIVILATTLLQTGNTIALGTPLSNVTKVTLFYLLYVHST